MIEVVFLVLGYVIGYSIFFLNTMPTVRKKYVPLTNTLMTSVAVAILYWPFLLLIMLFMTVLEILHII